MRRIGLLLLALVLASCDQGPTVGDKNSTEDSWIQRSEKKCGPGYLAMIWHDKGDNLPVCIAYKLQGAEIHKEHVE